jgi:soluble lytic murein transglycosylase-like protein
MSSRFLRTPINTLQRLGCNVAHSIATLIRDIGRGLFEISHNSLALMGLAIVALLVSVGSQTELRASLEKNTLWWLQSRHAARVEGTSEAIAGINDPSAIQRATATDPKALSKEQHLVAQWLARRYHVAPEPVSRLVKEAWSVGRQAGVEPTLILAVMAIESSFNPFAQSKVGAQGLMQVMTELHDEKYEPFGGNHAAFDPVTNLRVGVRVLKDCITQAGSIEAGLKFYVGAANLPTDGGYAWKVLAERQHLRAVSMGKAVPPTASHASATAAKSAGPAKIEAHHKVAALSETLR